MEFNYLDEHELSNFQFHFKLNFFLLSLLRACFKSKSYFISLHSNPQNSVKSLTASSLDFKCLFCTTISRLHEKIWSFSNSKAKPLHEVNKENFKPSSIEFLKFIAMTTLKSFTQSSSAVFRAIQFKLSVLTRNARY